MRKRRGNKKNKMLILTWKQCFVFQFCKIHGVAIIIKQEDFAKIRLQAIEESPQKIRSPIIFLATCWNLFSKFGDLKKKSPHNIVTYGPFFPPFFFFLGKETLYFFFIFLGHHDVKFGYTKKKQNTKWKI